MVAEDKRHLMQNLFGDQSEEEDEEVESEHESNRQPDYASDEGEIEQGPEVENVIEGQGEADVDSDVESRDREHEQIESEEVDLRDQRDEGDESEGNDSRNDQREDYGQRVVTSRRREIIESESERSDENHYVGNSHQEDDHATSPRSPDEAHISQTAPELREVFGESDEEDAEEYNQNHLKDNSNRSPMEEEGYENNLRPEDMLADEEGQYYSEEENIEIKTKDKPMGPPLELGIPLRPPSHPEKMNMIKVSNIMGIDPKPFDPKTYVEEDAFVTDESGHNKRIRLENNIVRHRAVRNPDGTKSYESNARFIRWSDGSLQLQIGNEVLDISVQDAQHDQAHLFLRHEKGILQSQGRVLRKMRFMPSSLSSNSHRLLTALVDSRHKKVFRVKNCVTAIDPEREKEAKEKAESQTIRANELLSRKKEKVNRKYTHSSSVRRERQLSPGFLEDALDEDDEGDYYDSRRSSARRRFEEDLEMEARAEKRIINAKRSQGHNDIGRKSSGPSMKSSRRPVEEYESEREESEYETEEEEETKHYDDEEEEEDSPLPDEDEPKLKHEGGGSGGGSSSKKRKEMYSEEEESSPRKPTTYHRRKAIVYDSDED